MSQSLLSSEFSEFLRSLSFKFDRIPHHLSVTNAVGLIFVSLQRGNRFRFHNVAVACSSSRGDRTSRDGGRGAGVE